MVENAMLSAGALLIGVDGGATEVKVHAVTCDDLRHPASFQLRPESASRAYEAVPGFAPLAVAEQLAARERGTIELCAAESEQGRLWVAVAADAIGDVAGQCQARRVLVGIGMPGLKTPDGRGIGVINNGPRIPDYLDGLEKRLKAAGVDLVAPIAALGSDADYCGLGEQHAADGLFRDVENAYYVGGGTGLADALKLRGRLVPFDEAKSWILKSWQIPSTLGPTFEKLVSAASLNRAYADLAAADGSGSDYPEVAAVAGDPTAIGWLDTAARVLAELVFERLWTIRSGRAEAAGRGEAYAALEVNHEYRGVLLDRVVIGQRVGVIYADEAYRAVFAEKLDAYLAALVGGCADSGMGGAYLVGGGSVGGAHATLRPGFVRGSKLRAAPALGAAVSAVHALAVRRKRVQAPR